MKLLTLVPCLALLQVTYADMNQQTDCGIDLVDSLFDDVATEWKGTCTSGDAEGFGTLEWRSEGVVYWTAVYSEATGLIMRAGRTESTIGATDIDLELQECGEYRKVKAEIPDTIDARYPVVVNKILEITKERAWSECPKGTGQGVVSTAISVSILQGGKEIASAHSQDTDNEWRDYINIRTQDAVSLARRTVYEAREKRQKREEADRLRREAEAIVQAEREAREQFDEFVRRSGTREWPQPKSFVRNPFVHGNDIIAFYASFDSMTEKGTGIFILPGRRPVLVSDIPNGKFEEETELLFAAEVLGHEITVLPRFGLSQAPLLRFVDSYSCSLKRCRDILMWMENP